MNHTKLLKEFTAGWKHFCGCIDFGSSNLDEEAIRFMWEMPQRISRCVNNFDTLLEACKALVNAPADNADHHHRAIMDAKRAIAAAESEV